MMRAGVLWSIDLWPWAIEVTGPVNGGELRLGCEKDVKDEVAARGPGGVQGGLAVDGEGGRYRGCSSGGRR